ncbi:hypothetical protein GCM10007887_39330 [Methylobacterium haplocladii]|uniref:IstB-like ATP-binding domain-containing protein n=1 Tax=Methylobacterium haplocladii TaxID=1176176 RepID=A0A512IW16_9HYPH|nr:hypothetical protein MHA02_43070 [Methylobacterium haplocladii]GLS61235.1 hypothetical protein GCM10007887_39330 [Methylobacterium haplocladii]
MARSQKIRAPYSSSRCRRNKASFSLPPGYTRTKPVKKTHIALALGLGACQKGFSVAFTTAASLVKQLLEARNARRLRRL